MIWWMLPDRDAGHTARSQVQAAVMFGGFVALDGNRVVELDHHGDVRDEVKLASMPAAPRVVGASDRVGLVWRDGHKIAVAGIDHEGSLGKPQRFGKRVQRVCDGLATNDHQFAAGWTESDGVIWFVHGPTMASLAALDGGETVPVAVANNEPCWIASAGESIALMWREKRRTLLALCGKKCELGQRVMLPADATPLGVGCARIGCAVVSRSETGALQATWVDTSKRPHRERWTKPLPSAAREGRVEIVGTGSQVAIAYSTGGEPLVVVANAAGTIAPSWQHAADEIPSIAWSLGRVLVTHHVGGELRSNSIAVP
ncbi:MAG: hypothetical protein AB7R00_14390 [Kofleriaceae bacterium]